MNVLHKIKRLKIVFYITNIFKSLVPNFFYKINIKRIVNEKNRNIDFTKRLEYYISSKINTTFSKNWIALKDYKRPKKGSMYYYDLLKCTKYFSSEKRIHYKFGDVTENFTEPTIVKSRPVDHNGNSVIMKINQLRHFNFIKDNRKFHEKKDEIVWRGEIHKENRRLLLEKFYQEKGCNIGEVSRKNNRNLKWQKEFLNINQQLDYKFILSIEGNDVATNLKWIMSSNSLCFMPKPKFETWFMEGKLVANYHYVLIKDDYSDLLEKREFYLNNEDKALQIIKNANLWTKQFQNKRVEKILSLAVLNQFFEQTKQNER